MMAVAPGSGRLARGALVLGIGCALWALRPVTAFWGLLLAYVAAWVLGNLALRFRGSDWLAVPRTAVLCLLVIVSLPAIGDLVRFGPLIARQEALLGFATRTADRLRVEQVPSIAPPVVFADHPQTFYVHSPGAFEVGVTFAEAGPLPATDLGEGLFRIHYDPRRDGAIPPGVGPLEATVVVDGSPVERRLTGVTPLPHPRWLSAAPERGLAATVSTESDELYIVGRRGLRQRIAVEDGPVDAVFFDDGQGIAVSHRYSPDLTLIDADEGKTLRRVRVGPFQTRLAVSPDQSLLAVGLDGPAPGIQLLSLPDGSPEAFVLTSFDPDWIAFGSDESTLLVASRRDRTLRRIGASNGRWVVDDDLLQLAQPVVTMTRADEGASLLAAVTDYRSDGLPHEGNHFVEDQVITIDTRTLRITDRVVTARRSPRQDKPGNIDRGGSPMGIAVLQDGSVLIAYAGTSGLAWLEPEQSRPAWTSTHDLPLAAPHGVADLGEGFVVASSPASGTLAVFAPGGELAALSHVAPKAEELAARDPESLEIRNGEITFYETTRSGISCQSCHLHGDSDHAEHNLNLSATTRSVRGLAGTSPYLTDGSFARIGDLDFVSQTRFRGYLRTLPDRPKALEAYVHALPRATNPAASAARAADRDREGVAAFVKADCQHCHAFPAFTNLGQHPVRAVWPEHGAELHAARVLDTPSLLGLYPPRAYLHDGRAASLEQVLTDENPSNRHGNVEALSEAERKSLVRFLEAL